MLVSQIKLGLPVDRFANYWMIPLCFLVHKESFEALFELFYLTKVENSKLQLMPTPYLYLPGWKAGSALLEKVTCLKMSGFAILVRKDSKALNIYSRYFFVIIDKQIENHQHCQ